ncbi:MAG: glycosyltransferase family 39 protein, partial [bacterium]|nr:glycosyltransferase family 39 protein [bacterium]
SFWTIMGVYLLIKKAFKSSSLALLASLFYALSYFQIQYAMEARMYALGTFLVVIASYLLLIALEKRKLGWWALYALAVSLGIYTHYFIAFWTISQAIYVICFFRKEFKFAFLSYLMALISYIPWLPTFFRQFNQVQETYWIPPMNVWSIPNTLSKMTVGAVVDPGENWPILVLLMALVAAASIFFLKKTRTKEKWLFAIQFFLPFLITAALSYKRSIYIDRYFIFGFFSYLLILAGAILLINKKFVKLILISAALIGVSITFPYQWDRLNVEKKPGMAAAAKYINENVKPEEKIFVSSSLIYFTFKYYNESEIQAKLYAPGRLPHFSGTALLSKEDIIVNFSEETIKGYIVWILNSTGFGNYQPTLPQNWLKEDEKGFEEVNAYQGWIVIAKYKVE